MKRFGALAIVVLLLAGCEQPRSSTSASSGGDAGVSEKYGRDRELCRAQVDEYMRNRRVADDSRRDVFADQNQRYGTAQVQDQMASYGDTKNYDRVMGDCMAQRGWPQPKQDWWQKLGQPHTF